MGPLVSESWCHQRPTLHLGASPKGTRGDVHRTREDGASDSVIEHEAQGRSPGLPPPARVAPSYEYTELPLRVGLSSRAGPVRELNEDYAAYFMPDDAASRRARGSLFLVADGMGGHQAGEIASREAVTRVIQEYLADDTSEPGKSLLRAIRLANRWVYEQAQSDQARQGMGTTLVAAVIRGRQVYVANVGDSRAYVANRTGITQITQDHSWVEEQVQAGLLTQAQAGRHPQRNLITRALGHRRDLEIDLFEGEMFPGDLLLLCTDGVSGALSAEQIARAVCEQPPASAAAALVTQAGVAGGDDNATALIVEALGAPAQWKDGNRSRATEAGLPGLHWLADWLNNPGLFHLGVKRQRLVVGLASMAFFLCLCSALVLFLAMGQGPQRRPVSAPQVAPLRDARLTGTSAEQLAHYLGYSDEAEMISAHQGQVNWSSLATADLWPSSPKVLLVGTARSWRCDVGDCVFVVRMAGTDHTVYYSAPADAESSLNGRMVRVLGSQQDQTPGLMAEFIERGNAWWVWWQPAWQIVYPGNLGQRTMWVYGTVERNPYGLLDTEEHTPLDRGSQVLVRGQWTEKGHSSAMTEEEVYQLQGGRYLPVSTQGVVVPQPTVTLQPTPTKGETKHSRQTVHVLTQHREREMSYE